MAPSIRVGLDQLHYALLTSDPDTGVPTYGQVYAISNAVTANIQPKANTATFYADDGAAETATAVGEIQVDFETNSLSSADQARLLGATIGTDGTVLQKSTDIAPYVALGFRSKKANGNYRFYWLYKGKAMPYQEQSQTEEATPKGQPDKITFTFIRRQCDNAWMLKADEDDVSFTGGATWFDAVVEQQTSTAAPTVTVTPASGATAVADTSTVQWVFNTAIDPNTVNGGNFFVLDSTTGAQVAGALSQSADEKTITFTPTASLAATTSYTAIATTNVRDTAGIALVANSETEFTTA
ncbi:major tail protein [Alicyclobacillus sp. ALC3]|uniref:major tail protein n=1 Tax=Alicyclobacillus sp. ALC3 TaxID=2796143 RepID=UPI0023799A39|nr:major tail protein [Alicyclobacillus sp. ALC3]WDL98125.1 Ig-like domain-containing protein [Alicyclobacillus sp. ALC3]